MGATKGLEGGMRRERTFFLFSVPLAMLQQPQIVNSSLQLLQYSQHLSFHAPSDVPATVKPQILGSAGTNHAMLPLPLGQAPLQGLRLPDHGLSLEDQALIKRIFEVQQSHNYSPPQNLEQKR